MWHTQSLPKLHHTNHTIKFHYCTRPRCWYMYIYSTGKLYVHCVPQSIMVQTRTTHTHYTKTRTLLTLDWQYIYKCCLLSIGLGTIRTVGKWRVLKWLSMSTHTKESLGLTWSTWYVWVQRTCMYRMSVCLRTSPSLILNGHVHRVPHTTTDDIHCRHMTPLYPLLITVVQQTVA